MSCTTAASQLLLQVVADYTRLSAVQAVLLVVRGPEHLDRLGRRPARAVQASHAQRHPPAAGRRDRSVSASAASADRVAATGGSPRRTHPATPHHRRRS
jgi:hypothetical protein